MKYFDYSTKYDPPAPVIEITLVTPTNRLQIGPLTALVDSGADGTIVPINYLHKINASAIAERFVRGPWGERHRVLLYLVNIQIGNITLYGMQVAGDEELDEIILGRDTLNQLRIMLDGLGESVEVSQ